jgi:hypothetical protein
MTVFLEEISNAVGEMEKEGLRSLGVCSPLLREEGTGLKNHMVQR